MHDYSGTVFQPDRFIHMPSAAIKDALCRQYCAAGMCKGYRYLCRHIHRSTFSAVYAQAESTKDTGHEAVGSDVCIDGADDSGRNAVLYRYLRDE